MSGPSVGDVVALLAVFDPARVEIVGDGELAGALRDAVGTTARPGAGEVRATWRRALPGRLRGATGAERPLAIAETTGEAGALAGAAARLADGGLLVLAGDGGPDTIALDLYRDIHRRGLRVVGLAGAAGWER